MLSNNKNGTNTTTGRMLSQLSDCLPSCLSRTHPSVCLLFICQSVSLSVCPSTFLCSCQSVCPYVWLFCLSVHRLSVYMSVSLSVCFVCLSVCPCLYLSVCLFCLSVHLSICLSVCLSVCPCLYLSVCLFCLSVHLSICLSVCSGSVYFHTISISSSTTYSLQNIKKNTLPAITKKHHMMYKIIRCDTHTKKRNVTRMRRKQLPLYKGTS